MVTKTIGDNTTGTVPDYSGFEDIWLKGNDATTNQAGNGIKVASWDSGSNDFSVTLFRATGMSSLPAGLGTITGARLKLYQKSWTDFGSGGTQCSLHFAPSLRAWVQSQATWNVYSTGNSWAAAGGTTNTADYDSANDVNIGTTTSSANDNSYVTFDLSAMASYFDSIYNSAATNNGIAAWFLPRTTETEELPWGASDETDGQRPILELDFTSSGTTKALTGQSITSSIGSFGKTVSKALVGQSITSSLGTLGDAVSKALTGQSATFSQGTLADSVSKALSGQAITSSLGSLSDVIDVALTGQAIVSGQGTISADNAVTRALTGQEITSNLGALSDVVDKALTGQAITLSQGDLTDGVAYGITGQSITSAQGSLLDGVSIALSSQEIVTQQGDITSNGDVTRALTGIEVSVQQGSLAVESIASGQLGFWGNPYKKKQRDTGYDPSYNPLAEPILTSTSEDNTKQVQIPQQVQEIISNVAKIENERKQRAALKAQLKAIEIQFKQEYVDALKTEMIKNYLIMVQEQEEQDIAFVMMAMVA